MWVENRPQKEESFRGVLARSTQKPKRGPGSDRGAHAQTRDRGLGFQSSPHCARGKFPGLSRSLSKVGNEQQK